ncbi:hypothetical protein [Arthrobacter sp. efr-133-TYG-118]|uniref:hypothetical protein n=1 Tax=Arthrobacter sp. efr-133-TYG-118 TaxID=3040279 RepID=UPI002550426F|nr:hypothetical protein [Arthrobacter sp. efr-133-TYG-118]
MKIWLTVQDPTGREATPPRFEYVEADAEDYQIALTNALALVSDGWKVINIRASENSSDPRIPINTEAVIAAAER